MLLRESLAIIENRLKARIRKPSNQEEFAPEILFHVRWG